MSGCSRCCCYCCCYQCATAAAAAQLPGGASFSTVTCPCSTRHVSVQQVLVKAQLWLINNTPPSNVRMAAARAPNASCLNQPKEGEDRRGGGAATDIQWYVCICAGGAVEGTVVADQQHPIITSPNGSCQVTKWLLLESYRGGGQGGGGGGGGPKKNQHTS
jgi:hypothetical protein